jgi:hypothetical protein
MRGGEWYTVFDQEIGSRDVMMNRLEFSSEQDILEGILVYKIQRQHAESDESIQDESKCIQLLVAWHVEHTKGLHVRALLVEHDKEFNWDEDKLEQLHQKYWHSLDAWVHSDGGNWILDDESVLTLPVALTNGGYKFEIFISEEKKYINVMKPFWLDVERQVLIVFF